LQTTSYDKSGDPRNFSLRLPVNGPAPNNLPRAGEADWGFKISNEDRAAGALQS
jgi:hypothetical protein